MASGSCSSHRLVLSGFNCDKSPELPHVGVGRSHKITSKFIYTDVDNLKFYLARDLCALPHRPPLRLLPTQPLSSFGVRAAREPSRCKMETSLLVISQNGVGVTFPILFLRRVVIRSSHIQAGGDYTRTWISRSGNHWSLLRKDLWAKRPVNVVIHAFKCRMPSASALVTP